MADSGVIQSFAIEIYRLTINSEVLRYGVCVYYDGCCNILSPSLLERIEMAL